MWQRVFEIGRVSEQIERYSDDSCESGLDIKDIIENSSRKRTYSIGQCRKNITIYLIVESTWQLYAIEIEHNRRRHIYEPDTIQRNIPIHKSIWTVEKYRISNVET